MPALDANRSASRQAVKHARKRKPTPRTVVRTTTPAPQTRRPDYSGARPVVRVKPPSPSQARRLSHAQEQAYRSQGKAVRHVAHQQRAAGLAHTQEHQYKSQGRAVEHAANHRRAVRRRLFGNPVKGLKRSEQHAIRSLAQLRASDPQRYKENIRKANDLHVLGVNVEKPARDVHEAAGKAGEFLKKQARTKAGKTLTSAAFKSAGVGNLNSTKLTTEVIDLAANTPTSLYLTGVAGVHAAEGDSRQLKKLWKDYKKTSAVSAAVSGNFKAAAKRAENHPIATALELSGGKAVIGRVGGAFARHAPSARVRAAGSTARPNLKLYPKGQRGPETERQYSRDIINKGIQVAGEKIASKRGRDPHRDSGSRYSVAMPKRMGGGHEPGAANHAKLNRRVDTRVHSQNRVSQDRKANAEHAVRKILKKRNAAGVQLVAEGVARTDRLRADLRKRLLHLAREYKSLTDPERKRLNRAEAKHIRELEHLPDDKLMRVVQGAEEFAKQQRPVQERGHTAGAFDQVGQSSRFDPYLQSHVRRTAGEERAGLSPEDRRVAAKVLQRRARRGKPLPSKISAAALHEVRRRERARSVVPGAGLAEAVARVSEARVPRVPARRATPDEFGRAFAEAKAGGRGTFLSDYSKADRAKQTLLLSEDGKAGAAVKPDGDIVSVFRLPGAEKGAGRAMLRAALAHGGNKLVAIGDDLRKLYESEGFKVTETVPWDDRYAPPGWDYATMGRPNIYFMKYAPTRGRGATGSPVAVHGRADAALRGADAGAGDASASVRAGAPGADVSGLGRAAGRGGTGAASELASRAVRRPRVGQAKGVTRADFESALGGFTRRLRVGARPLTREERATAARTAQRYTRRHGGRAPFSSTVEGGPVLVTHRPGRGRTSARVGPSAPFEPMRARSGLAFEQGSREVGRGALVRQAVASETQVTAAEGFQLLDREFSIPAGRGARRYAESRDKALEEARRLTLDPNTGELLPGRERLVPVNIAQFQTFGPRLRAKQEQGMPRSYAAINDMERQALEDTWSAALNESGRGKWVLWPESVASRFSEHLKVGNFGPLHSVTNIFKDIVLTSSSPARWLGGNVTDLVMRTAFEGITPLDIIRGRKIVRNAQQRGLQGEQAVAAVTGGGFFHANTALNRAMRPRGYEEHVARTVLSAPWRAWKGAVYTLEHHLEELPQHGAVGKAMRRESGRSFHTADGAMKRDLKTLLKLHDKQIDHFAEKLATDRATEARIQKLTEDVIGRWGKISPNMRRLLVLAPFAQWLGAAVRYVFVTLPVHHPIKTALIAGMSEMTEDERRKLGLSYYLPRQDQVYDYQMGSLPTSVGQNKYGPVVKGVRTSHMLSFGTAAQAAGGDVAGYLFPQFSGALDAWAGTSFTNEPLTYPDWWPEVDKRRLPLPPDVRQKVGLGALLESSVPFLSAFRRIVLDKGRPEEPFSTVLTPATRKKFDKENKTFVENQGTTLGGILEWLSPAPPPQRLYTYGTGKAIEEQGITGETLDKWRQRRQSKSGDVFSGSSAQQDNQDIFAPKKSKTTDSRDIFAK